MSLSVWAKAVAMRSNSHSAQAMLSLNGGIRPPDGLARSAQGETRPEAAFHPKQLHRYG